ncbi:MAG: pirin family protein [Candidatus Methylacidiphilales bacterium]|nr:pirin family protein [Candidatus Methylacidiphilales bacterium]
MIHLRKASDRGHTDFGWLDSRHTFSFGEYQDPAHIEFGPLRVINDDRVAGGGGFPTHPHRDMEIFSYVVEGALQHRDSMGHGSIVRAGGVQRITAGRGIAHSEFNPSPSEAVHFLQIWIKPKARGLDPGYAEKQFSREEKLNRLHPILSPDGREGSVTLQQDAVVYASILEPGRRVTHALPSPRQAWIQIVRGALKLNGQTLGTGDGAAVEGETDLLLEASEESEFLLIDLPDA